MHIPVVSVVGLAGLLLVVVYKCLVYPVFLSPLSKVPAAHPLAKITSLWILWVRYRRRENETIYNAHCRLGEVVQLGPNELSVNCVDNGIRTIYAGGFEKHEWYANQFSNFDSVHTMFSTVHSKPHSWRKRMLSNVYSKSYLQNSPTAAAIGEHLIYKRFLPKVIAAADTGAVLNIFHLMNSATMDFVTAYKFGLSNSSNFMENSDQNSWWIHNYLQRRKYTFWSAEALKLSTFLARIGIRVPPSWVAESSAQLEDWTLQMCDAAAAAESKEAVSTDTSLPENVPVVFRQLTASLDENNRKSAAYVPLSGNEDRRLAVASELLDNLAAGHETSAVTLTYLFHELSQDQPLQQNLRQELLSLSPQVNVANMTSAGHATLPHLPSAKDIDALPLLHATIMETLRLHAAIPGPQPRVTPQGITQLGKFVGIPGGVRVSASPHSLHRNPDVFTDPLVFNVYRWLPSSFSASPEGSASQDSDKENASRRAEMNRWFWAFGSGGRMCIGSNMAMLQMKLIVVALVSTCWTECVDDTGIEQEDAYTAHPVGGGLKVRFHQW